MTIIYTLAELPLAPQDMTTWLARYPEAFTENGGMGLGKHQAPVLIECKPVATSAQV